LKALVVVVALASFGCGPVCSGPRAPSATATRSDKIDGTPDFMQTSHPELPGGGRNYCAPVAVSNGLVWLGENGFPDLLPAGTDRGARQLRLIRTLGSADYMDTDPDGGTDADQLLEGLDAYLVDQGYGDATLRVQTWRAHDDRFATGVSTPSVAWAADHVDGDTAVFLNVGWYAYDDARDEFARDGGHWVTLVGTEEDPETGRTSFIVHDPSRRSGRAPRSEVVTTERLTSGRLTGTVRGLPRAARGFTELGGELRFGADAALLDAVVVLSL
jgi:hypothetical protein